MVAEGFLDEDAHSWVVSVGRVGEDDGVELDRLRAYEWHSCLGSVRREQVHGVAVERDGHADGAVGVEGGADGVAAGDVGAGVHDDGDMATWRLGDLATVDGSGFARFHGQCCRCLAGCVSARRCETSEVHGESSRELDDGVGEVDDDPIDDDGVLHLGEFEGEGTNDVVLLGVGEAVPEEGGLGVMVVETRGLHPFLHPVHALRVVDEHARPSVEANGQPPPTRLGAYAVFSGCTTCWCRPSRWFRGT